MMHNHTTKALATLESEAPLIQAVATLDAETILTKAVAVSVTLEHVETLDMMRVAVGEESNQATTLPDGEDKDQVPTTGGRDKVTNMLLA